MFGKLHAFRQEAALERRDRLVRIAFAADENIKRGVIAFRPSVNGHMAFRQHQPARNPALGLVNMEMPVQDCPTRWIPPLPSTRFL